MKIQRPKAAVEPNQVERPAWHVLTMVVLLFSLFATTHLTAQELPSEGPAAGRALAAHLRSLRPTEEYKWRGTMKIMGRDHKALSVPMLCEATLTPTNWSVMYLAAATAVTPSEKLTVVFSTNMPNEYVFAQAATPGGPLEPPKTLMGEQADIPLAGSDFWLSDLGFEFYHWPDQVLLHGQMRRGRSCYVLESRNPHPAPGGYSRVVTWVDRESEQPLQAEAYGADGKLMKEFEIGSVAKVNGRWEVKNLKMFNRKAGSRTYINFDLKSQ